MVLNFLMHHTEQKEHQQINLVLRKRNLSLLVYLQGKNTKTVNDNKYF